MNKFYIFCLAFFCGFGLNAQTTFNAYSDNIAGAPSGSIDVEIQLSFDVAGGLGSSNLALQVNPTVLGVPTLFSSPILGNGNYSQTNFISNNGGGQYTVNFALNVTNAGIPIGTGPTSVAVLRFPVLNAAGLSTAMVDFLNDPDQLVVFRDNNSTLLNIGSLLASALPIKLSKFDVRPFGGIKASDLRWTSVAEINASHFEIERSIDGSNFEYVGTTKATGNTNWSIDYNFVDRTLPNTRTGKEIYYYRLRMVDLDGSAEYSDVRSIRFDSEDDVVVKMGPNPTTSTLSINMSSPNAIDAEAPANIYDAAGKLMMTSSVNTNGITEIDLSNVPNAIYNVSIEYNGKSYNNRIIKSN